MNAGMEEWMDRWTTAYLAMLEKAASASAHNALDHAPRRGCASPDCEDLQKRRKRQREFKCLSMWMVR